MKKALRRWDKDGASSAECQNTPRLVEKTPNNVHHFRDSSGRMYFKYVEPPSEEVPARRHAMQVKALVETHKRRAELDDLWNRNWTDPFYVNIKPKAGKLGITVTGKACNTFKAACPRLYATIWRTDPRPNRLRSENAVSMHTTECW